MQEAPDSFPNCVVVPPPRSVDQQRSEAPTDITTVPRFVVDLDAPVATRWKDVVEEYRQEILFLRDSMRKEIAGMVGGAAMKLIDSFGSMASTLLSPFVKYSKEIKGFAKLVGIPVQEILVIQFMYEACSACTSIVIPGYGANGEPTHIRTMDWEMPELKALTIEVEFWKNGAPLFVTTTWPGYIGVLTGMRYGAFSSSVNFRLTGSSYLNNVKNALTYCWPIGFLLRAVLEDDSDYGTAVGHLACSQLISPVYFTCCGISKDQGCIITRGREKEENRWNISELGTAVQTNIDHWSNEDDEDILYSIQRRELARELCNVLQDVTKETMFGILSKFPILNDLTVSATWMCPSTNEFESRLPNGKRIGFKPSEDAAPFGGEIRVQCTSCSRRFNPNANVEKQCSHVGKWHDVFSDCGVSCGRIGVTNLGKCHWSCCFAVDKNSPCKKSSYHIH
mmetsp:Transcript_1221/g.1534  ORF Transcript_1221/g.1534 Transcript_1221/m.1534 type:complete len:451 (-) Transcript_1221:75-1427(-)